MASPREKDEGEEERKEKEDIFAFFEFSGLKPEFIFFLFFLVKMTLTFSFQTINCFMD